MTDPDYGAALRSIGTAGPSLAAANINENPDEGARAMQLGQSSGVPPEVVHGDLDGFENDYKTSLAIGLLKSNPQLDAYVQSHPFASVVSNDDYANLDKLSQSSGFLASAKRILDAPHQIFESAVEKGIEGFREGWGSDPTGSWIDKNFPAVAANPYLRAAAVTLYGPAEGVYRTLAAAPAAISGAAGGAAEAGYLALTGDESGAKLFSRDISSIAEYEIAKGDMALHEPTAQAGQMIRLREARIASLQWAREGLEPPAGVHPLIDELKTNLNRSMLDQLDQSLVDAQQALTKQRSPELMENFLEQHYGDSTIAIHGDAVAALYGENAPAPGDGLLGFVPGIADKLALARETGSDVSIPIKSWLTHVDPKVAQALHDDTRMYPGGITAREATLPMEPKAIVDEPLPAMRSAAGLEPMFAIGDRKITLKDENQAIQRYQGNHSVAGNVLLRQGEDAFNQQYSMFGGKKFRDQVQKTIDVMDSMVKPSDLDRTLYRAMPLPDDIKVGDVVTDPGFASTSTATGNPTLLADARGQHLVEITAPKGSPLIDFENRGPERNEVVLPRGSSLRITSVEGKRAKAEIVRQDLPVPQMAVGSKKVTVSRAADTPGFSEFHNYQMLDENGKPIGELEILPNPEKKQLYVANITGLAGMYSNSFGPALVRDIKRQLKELYPDYETITGHRVSGAREQAGVWEDPTKSNPVVQLDQPGIDTGADLKQLFQDTWRTRYDYGHNITAAQKAYEQMAPEEQQMASIVYTELKKTVGDIPTLHLVTAISKNDGTIGPSGVFMQYMDKAPKILVDLLNPDSLGVARHESIHFLRQYGFFKDEEWELLQKAAIDGDWLGRYNIDTRYKSLDQEGKLEEAIAEGYREWSREYDTDPASAMKEPYANIFYRLRDLWENIKARFKEAFGREPNYDDIFQKVYHGEVGAREGAQPLHWGAWKPQFAEADERFNMLKAEATGLDSVSYKKLQDLVNRRYEEDLAAAQAKAERDQAKRQTKEWKQNSADMRKVVEGNIRNRPDVASDLFLGSGELMTADGPTKLRQRYTLRAEDLTPEQIAALPKHYVSKSGLPVDQVAAMFGYPSGDAMVEKLAEYNAAKGNLSPQEMLRKVIDDETNRQMEAKYGSLHDNIMSDAKDQALSETNLNLLAEELHAAGMMAKQPVIDKDVAKSWVKDQFSKLPVEAVSSDRFLAEMGRNSRDVERALIGNDPAAALQGLQRKYLNGLLASEARKFEKEMASFDKEAKRLSKREIPTIDPEYTNFIHDILMRVGKPVRRSVQDLEAAMQAEVSEGDMAKFVAAKQGFLREVPVWPQLFDRNWRKQIDDMTTDEFRAVNDSIKALAFNGRDELKIMKQGEAADLAEVKRMLKDQFKGAAQIEYTASDSGLRNEAFANARKAIRTFYVNHLILETIFNRWDKFKSDGPWNSYVMRDLIDSANQEAAWRKEFAEKLQAAGDSVDLNKAVENNLFTDPNGNLFSMNRHNLRAVMLNMGTDSNLRKLIGGWKVDGTALINWVSKHATKEDWDFCQKIWDIFAEMKERSDTMYRSLTGGVAPESIPARAFNTQFGKYKGGYYPIVYHGTFEGDSVKLMGGDALEGQGYVRATVPAGYTKSRTGYMAPLSLELDALPSRLGQIIHDTAMRPAVINASKIFYDKDIRNTITGTYGKEYTDLLVPYLKDVANSANYVSQAQRDMARWSEFIRQNMITTLVGLNPGTVLKHGPTALVQSMQEVGPVSFLKAVKSLFSVSEETGESNWQFAMNNSLELQRRHQMYEETLGGAAQTSLLPKDKFDSLRRTVIKYASMPVALSDLASAVPTWLAKYEESTLAGMTHGDSIYEADRAVRRAHGSTAVTNRPAIMRSTNPLTGWLTSVYTFFNHIMNRQAEMVWKAGDIYGLTKDGDFAGAMKQFGATTAQLASYVVIPAIIEQMVSPLEGKPNDSWEKKAAKGLAFTLSASWIGVRDLAAGLLNGKDPTIGLFNTAASEITNFARDLQKDQPMNKAHAGRLIQDATGLAGMGTGMAPLQVGKAARFLYGVNQGIEHPRNGWQWLTGLRYGTLNRRP